jgi:hypothetical protein
MGNTDNLDRTGIVPKAKDRNGLASQEKRQVVLSIRTDNRSYRM